MPDIVITEFMDRRALDDLRRDFEVHYDPGLADQPDELMRVAAEAGALIVRNRTQVRLPLIAACRRLVAVGRLGVGLDNIDLDACKARGIEVLAATGANAVAVGEYVLAAALIALRDVWHASEHVLAGAWPRTDLVFREASGKLLGLVGFGGIARAVAERARAFAFRLAACDPGVGAEDPAWAHLGVERMDLESLLGASDVVSIHTPLVPATRHLIDGTALARMKPGAILINSARGGIVDERALVAALKAGRLGAAVLDVFETEPLPAGSLFVGVPNLHLTPHIAGVTEEANQRVSALTAANVRRALGRRL
ncbi:MAG: hydroxyacid dehydrogenase [Pseudomonadota bacterium]